MRSSFAKKMKNLPWTLRAMLLVHIAFGAGSLVVDQFTQDSLPSSLRDYYYSELFEQYPVVANSMGIVFVGLMVISWIGLWFFWNPARYIYAIALAVTWITTPLLGPSVSTAWGGTLEEASTMTAGAILVLIFLPLPQNLWVKHIVLEQTKNDCEDGCQ
jgi:hypothetical protein